VSVIGGKYIHPQIFDGFSLPPGTHSPVAATDPLRSTVTVAAVAPVVSLAAVAVGAWASGAAAARVTGSIT